MKKFYAIAVLTLFFLCPDLKKIDAQESDKQNEGASKKEEEIQNAWKINPFAKHKYVPPYPPEKFAYNFQEDKLTYRSKYSYEAKIGGKLFDKEEGEDLHINFLTKNLKKIDLPTGSKHGIGTLKEEIKLLKTNEKENKNAIKRNENIIKILEKNQRKIFVFDVYRYKLRHPLKFNTIQNDKIIDITQGLYDSAQLGYFHSMIQTQIDEGGLLTEEGSRLAKRDEREDLSKRMGPIYAWWDLVFNHWFDFEEFPILPADIDYIRQRRYFTVENMIADWEITMKESKSNKDIEPVDMFCVRWWGRNLKEAFPGAKDFSYKGIKPIIDWINADIKKADDQYKSWLKDEFKEKYLKNENIYSLKNGTKHKESEPIVRRQDNTLACIHNECEFVGKEKIDITGQDGKIDKYNCLHFRRTITIDDLGFPAMKLDIKKWQDDIWFDPITRLTVKRSFSLDFDVTFTSQLPVDPRNPKGAMNTITEVNGLKYDFNIELIEKVQSQGRSAELKILKDIVNSFNSAIGTEYKIVLDKLNSYKANYVDKTKNHEFATIVETMLKQSNRMLEIFTQAKGFKKHNPIFADEYFCTYVPEDFNPTEKYGLIVYLPDENENVEERIKEIGSLLLGKKLIALGIKPQLNFYDHKFEKSSKRLLDVVRGLGNTYNIDPKRRYMLGYGKGAQMVLTMLAYSLSDFDRFSLYIPLSGGYLPFADDCRKNINGPQGYSFQEAIFSSNVLFMYPSGIASIKQEGEAPDACTALSVSFANIRAQNPKYDKYVSRLMHQEKDVYNKNVAAYIINQIIPKIEKNIKDFFENPANTPGLQPILTVNPQEKK